MASNRTRTRTQTDRVDVDPTGIARGDVVREDFARYNADGEYEYGDAEYEYEAHNPMRQNKRMQWIRKSRSGLLAGRLTAH